jgi:hypothetical protein
MVTYFHGFGLVVKQNMRVAGAGGSKAAQVRVTRRQRERRRGWEPNIPFKDISSVLSSTRPHLLKILPLSYSVTSWHTLASGSSGNI